MSKKFSVIVSDPAWSFSDRLRMSDVPRGAEANYPVLDNQEIINLDVKSIADPNGCILALWVPSSLLQVGMDTMKAWGFEQKQTYIWVKTKKEPLAKLDKHIFKFMKAAWKMKDPFPLKEYLIGLRSTISMFVMNDALSFFMGRLFRQTHEICLIGTNNNKIYKKLENKSQRSVCFAPNLKHSAKPEDLQDSLEVMFPFAERLEMFARRERVGWTCIGNEIPSMLGEDIRDSLKKLI